MKLFIKVKAMNLFFLLVGSPIVFGIIISIFNLEGNILALSLINLIIMSIFFGWLGSIVYYFIKYLNGIHKIDYLKFRISLSFVILYIGLSPLFFIVGDKWGIIWIVLIFHLISFTLILYIFYFTASLLGKIEEKIIGKRNSIILGDFFLFWFFPIGVWIIQPRVNKLSDTLSI